MKPAPHTFCQRLPGTAQWESCVSGSNSNSQWKYCSCFSSEFSSLQKRNLPPPRFWFSPALPISLFMQILNILEWIQIVTDVSQDWDTIATVCWVFQCWGQVITSLYKKADISSVQHWGLSQFRMEKLIPPGLSNKGNLLSHWNTKSEGQASGTAWSCGSWQHRAICVAQPHPQAGLSRGCSNPGGRAFTYRVPFRRRENAVVPTSPAEMLRFALIGPAPLRSSHMDCDQRDQMQLSQTCQVPEPHGPSNSKRDR